MVLIGVLARIDPARRARLWQDLAARAGVQPFDLGEDGRIGILLEAETLDAAHDRLTHELDGLDGLLGTWPIYSDLSEEGGAETDAESDPAGARQAVLHGGGSK